MLPKKDIYVPYFNAAERAVIYSAVSEAAEGLREFYCFAPHEWFNHCYHVHTQGESGLKSTDAPVLAEVRQYQPVLHGTSRYPNDRYSICLYDQKILRTLWHESELEFFPFMLYILTHELIHIARFCQNLHPFDCDADALEKEEQKVTRLTQQVLKTHKSAAFSHISRIHQRLHHSPVPPCDLS